MCDGIFGRKSRVFSLNGYQHIDFKSILMAGTSISTHRFGFDPARKVGPIVEGEPDFLQNSHYLIFQYQ